MGYQLVHFVTLEQSFTVSEWLLTVCEAIFAISDGSNPVCHWTTSWLSGQERRLGSREGMKLCREEGMHGMMEGKEPSHPPLGKERHAHIPGPMRVATGDVSYLGLG